MQCQQSNRKREHISALGIEYSSFKKNKTDLRNLWQYCLLEIEANETVSKPIARKYHSEIQYNHRY